MNEAAQEAPSPPCRLTVNGRPCASALPASTRLSEVLRTELGRLDVKIGCNAGDCGSCTVLIDGAPVCACLTALSRAEGRHVETLAGLLVDEPLLTSLTAAFRERGAAQCGICTPGMLVAAVALLRANPAPDEAAVADALGGVLCRCTGYRHVVEAVLAAASVGIEPDGERREAGSASTADGGACGAAADDPPPDIAAPRSVGRGIARLDGAAKLEGRERFGDDVAPADALGLRLVRAPFHRAGFELGDVEAWRAARPGIERVLSARDVPGVNRFGVIPPFLDQPVFAEVETRFLGEAVAAVVGERAALAALPLDDFPVRWEEREPCLTPEQARAEDAPRLHPGHPGNILCRGLVRRGDAEAALARAAHVASARFTTGFVEHAYLEPEAGFARRVGDRLELHGCTQAPFMDRDAIASVLGIAPEAVRVVPSAVGGGFGSKLDLSFQPFVALAAWLLGRPVRIAYSRRESMQSTTKRHPATLDVAIGCDADGRLCGQRFGGTFNTGAYASWGPTVANRVPVHASGPYAVADYVARTTGVYTHCVPAGAFRGFGVPQAAVAQETLFDELAEACGMDRLAFRRRNALVDGQATVTGQRFASGVGIGACLERLAPHWERALADAASANEAAEAAEAAGKLAGKRDGPPERRGVGVACGWYGCGNTSLPNPSTIRAGIRPDGAVVLHQGAVDIGQGANTVIAQVFADALGVPLERIVLEGADTDRTPDAGKTSASRQTFVSGNAAKRCGEALRSAVLRGSNRPPHEIDAATLAARTPDADGYVFAASASYDPPTEALDEDGQGTAYAQYGYAAQMVELGVDVRLGTVRLHRFVAAHDVGRAINPVLVEGQVNGGIAQGIGLALMESFVPGRTENLHDYLIPTVGDVPPIETIIVEVADAAGPYGAKGLGEHVLIPTAPAILNAIRHACGARVRSLPATPERVLAGIREASGAGASDDGVAPGGGAR